MTRINRQDGFTLVELLVVMSLFAVLMVGFFSVMLSGVRGSDTTRSVVEISEEARLGFNRLVRDTREAAYLNAASPTSFTVHLDFNGNGTPGEPGDDEIETFTYDAASDSIVLVAGEAGCSTCDSAVLMNGVTPRGAQPIFDFSSNQLQFDRDDAGLGFVRDGVATWQEVDRPPAGETGGDADGQLGAAELKYLSNVSFVMDISSGDRTSALNVEAQLRNRRGEPSPLPN